MYLVFQSYYQEIATMERQKVILGTKRHKMLKIIVLINDPEIYKFLCNYGKSRSGVSTVQYTLYLHPSLSLSFL